MNRRPLNFAERYTAVARVASLDIRPGTPAIGAFRLSVKSYQLATEYLALWWSTPGTATNHPIFAIAAATGQDGIGGLR